MRHSRQQAEAGFGSDSFLDIVANIVGILIILIVMAGVRVGNAPVRLPTESSGPVLDPPHRRPKESLDAAVETAGDSQLPATATHPAAGDRTTADGDAHSKMPPEDLPPAEPPVELVRAVRELETEAVALEQQTRKLLQGTSGLRQRVQTAEDELHSLRRTVTALKADIERRKADLRRGDDRLAQLRAAVVAKRERVEAERMRHAEAKRIEHRLTPLSREVHGPEVHFRIKEGRVAYVPVDELVLRLRRRVQRDKDWLVRVGSHEGTVGPVGGFSLRYRVERLGVSALDELRYGAGFVRFGVTRWRVVPEPELETETIEEALRAGSRFIQRLKMADPGTTITLWVYPDSFSEFRELQSALHAAGFTVAARPLPFGVEISGSPQGTRSAAQ